MKKFGFALLAVAGLAAVANAQTVEYRWVAITTSSAAGALGSQVGNNTAVSGTSRDLADNQYRQRYELQARVTGTTGENNGLSGFTGNFDSAGGDALYNFKSTQAISGYTSGLGARNTASYSFAGYDTVLPFDDNAAAADSDLNVDSLRGASGATVSVTLTWVAGEAEPATPKYGADNWISIYRILVDTTTLGAGQYTISYTPTNTILVSDWATLDPVDPPTEEDINVTYYPQTQQVDGGTATSFVLNIVPAPASAALLGLGGLAAARRRRA